MVYVNRRRNAWTQSHIQEGDGTTMEVRVFLIRRIESQRVRVHSSIFL